MLVRAAGRFTPALDFAFAQLGRTEVVAMTAKIDVASQRVMQRLGMTYDPDGDFECPFAIEGSQLRPYVLYREHAPASVA